MRIVARALVVAARLARLAPAGARAGTYASCTLGTPGGEAKSHRLLTTRLRWAVGCVGEITGRCPTSYGGRARIRRQANLPYETGHSKRVTVHVR